MVDVPASGSCLLVTLPSRLYVDCESLPTGSIVSEALPRLSYLVVVASVVPPVTLQRPVNVFAGAVTVGRVVY